MSDQLGLCFRRVVLEAVGRYIKAEKVILRAGGQLVWVFNVDVPKSF